LPGQSGSDCRSPPYPPRTSRQSQMSVEVWITADLYSDVQLLL
jgi:hypothetical protein